MTNQESSATHLQQPDLSGDNHQGVDLRGADLRGADLSGKDFSKADLSDVNLSNANLCGTNFSEANLNRADLSQANLSQANLKSANLTIAKVLGTNFQEAVLTGACIEDWHINHETNLTQVVCKYIFLKCGWDRTTGDFMFLDRRPHDLGKSFAPGEFEKLFRTSLETTDLIFANGIDWSSFLEAFQQLRQEVNSEGVNIQAIERKGSAFIVRLEVPNQTDQSEIKKYVQQEYEAKLKSLQELYQEQLSFKNEQIEFYREENSKILDIIKRMAEPVRYSLRGAKFSGGVADRYNQLGNIGIGRNSGTISDSDTEKFDRVSGLDLGEYMDDLEADIDHTTIAALNDLAQSFHNCLDRKEYLKASELAESARIMCQEIADSFDRDDLRERDIHLKFNGLASYWKLNRDLYRGMAPHGR